MKKIIYKSYYIAVLNKEPVLEAVIGLSSILTKYC